MKDKDFKEFLKSIDQAKEIIDDKGTIMSDKDILYKAIKKAKKNGWVVNFPMKDIKDVLTYNKYITPVIYYWIIFSYDFAGAFWGNDELDERGRTLIEAWRKEYRDSGLFSDFDEFEGEPEIYYTIAWKYHLGKMVLCKEPLKYLEKFL